MDNDTLNEEQFTQNRILLWDIHRNIRFAKRRAGWFDGVIRTSSLLTSICASAAFASFAGDWPTFGMATSATAFFIALICKHFDYPAALADNRELLTACHALLARAEAAGEVRMPEAARRRIATALENLGKDLSPRFVANRPLLMCICENEAGECDLDAPLRPSAKIPWWGHLVCQVWPWRWPASVIAYPSAAEPPSAGPEASAEADAAPAGAAQSDSPAPCC